KVHKSRKKKLSAQGLETLSEIALSEAKQMKIATKKAGHKSIFLTPAVQGHIKDEGDKEEEIFDPRVRTPLHYESTDDEAYDEINQRDNVEEQKLDKEKIYKKEEVNELYNDVNIILKGRDTEMTDALLTYVQATQVVEDTHLANKMNEAIKTVVQLQSDRLRYEAQAENEDIINKLDENIKKIIKDQVKVQVKEQVSKILPRIEKLVNEQLEDEVLTRSSNEGKTSHAVAANLSELELKKILIDKIEKTLSRLKDVEMMRMITKNPPLDQTEGPREEELKEPESSSAPKEKTSKFKEGSKSHQKSTGKIISRSNILADERIVQESVELEYFLEEFYKVTTDQLDWNNPEGHRYPHDMRKPLPRISNSQVRRVIPFDHFINKDLAYRRGGASS
nr:hypothetical protein [Tanacetum cinerariifolium]